VDHALLDVIHEKKIFQATGILTIHYSADHYPQFVTSLAFSNLSQIDTLFRYEAIQYIRNA